MNKFEASDKVSPRLGCPDRCTLSESLDTVGREVTSRAYVKIAKTMEDADPKGTVKHIFGSLGVDSVNSTNEGVSYVTKEGCSETI